MRYITNITSASFIGTILSSELEVDGHDLVRLDQSGRGGGVACYIRSSTAYSYKDSFSITPKIFLLIFFCLNLSKSYWVSYINHPINQVLLNTLIMFSQKLGF